MRVDQDMIYMVRDMMYYSATDNVGDTGTATVTVTITNKLEFYASTLIGCVEAGAAACKNRSNNRYNKTYKQNTTCNDFKSGLFIDAVCLLI